MILILLLVIGYATTLFLAVFVGYKWRSMVLSIAALAKAVSEYGNRTYEQPRPKPDATLLDPDDVVARAQWEHDEQLRRLNEGKQ